jgi:ABC-type branched-subunit amino acid transport system ATPase component
LGEPLSERPAAPAAETSATIAPPRPVLAARDVTVRFGGVTAVDDVSLEVPPAAIVGLIGPNGAGKTTLLGVLSGFVAPSAGTVELRGADVTRLPAHARARRGLARTFQRPELFTEMSVSEHLLLAYRMSHERRRLVSDLYTGRGLRPPHGDEAQRVHQLLDLLGIRALAEAPVRGLPLGTTRLVELGRALATKPVVLLADEPFSGLNRRETERLATALTEIVRREEISLLLVEHDVDKVLEISLAVSLLDFGICVAAGTPEEIRADPRFRSVYLGEHWEGETEPAEAARVATGIGEVDIAPEEAAPAAGDGAAVAAGAPLLAVEHLSVSYGPAEALSDVSLELARGAAVAVLGANGAGKSTLCRTIAGLVSAREGRIAFGGAELTRMPAHQIRRLGLVYLPEERAIFPRLTVFENLKMGVATLARPERAEAIERAFGLFPILGERKGQIAGSLSGGQQQMLSLARALATRPLLVLADELSLGLAPGIIDVVFEAFGRAREEGISLLVIEQFTARALALCERAYILRRGTVVWHGDSAAAGDEVAAQYLGAGA